ncbi:MAG: hypothetical protein RL156_237 [Bacteroidota bacterium]|jgi:YfiH family protein
MKNLEIHNSHQNEYNAVFGIAAKNRHFDFLRAPGLNYDPSTNSNSNSNPNSNRSSVSSPTLDTKGVPDSSNSVASEESRSWSELSSALGFTKVVRRKQVHGIDIAVVDEHSSVYDGVADALITTHKDVLLAVTVADCCGIVLWHERVPLCACIHSGWRGTEQNIVAHVLTRMSALVSDEPSHFHAWLSPCASGRSYVVRRDVQQLFPAFCVEVSDGVYLFDNSAAIKAQLTECGLLPERIQVSQTCTIEDHRYHSFRRDGNSSGRNAVFVGMKSR